MANTKKRKNTLNENIILDEKHSFENHLWYSFMNTIGENVVIEITKTTHGLKSKRDLMRIWHKHGWMSERLSTHWSVNVYVTDIVGDCWGRYNPQVTKDHKINFDWILEATEENKIKILNEVYRLANWQYVHGRAMLLSEVKFIEFDKLDNLTPKAYLSIEAKAKRLYKSLTIRHFLPWHEQACFVSSSALHGFYFPNVQGLRAIAFRNGKAVIIYDDTDK